MRLVLPSGEYPLDGVWDFSRVSIADVLAFETAVDKQVGYISATQAVESLIGAVKSASAAGQGDALSEALAEYPALIQSLSWLVWLARHHAGDRQPNGAPLTMLDALGGRMSEVAFKADPGDDRGASVSVAEDPPDPQPPRRSGSGRGAPPKRNRKNAAGTSRTSTGRS